MSTAYGVNVEARAEDVRWMIETGANLDEAARRLGLTPKGLEKWCQRHGLAREAAILRRRNPLDLNAAPGVETLRSRCRT
jgi:transposase-like protein